MIVKISRSADQDVDEILEWYNRIDSEIGQDFIGELMNAIELIRTRPSAHPKLSSNIRRVLLNRFPYAVLFSVDESEKTVVIVSVVHQLRRRNH